MSITAGMSGQVDAARSAMPYGLKDIEEGKTRIIARAADIKVLQGRTVRVNFMSASTLVLTCDGADAVSSIWASRNSSRAAI